MKMTRHIHLLYTLLLLPLIISATVTNAAAAPLFSILSGISGVSGSSSHHHQHNQLLQRHRTLYTTRRPHSTTLYDILNVRYNATSDEIQKSWRKKSLEYHPDKLRSKLNSRQRHQHGGENSETSTNNGNNEEEEEYEKLQQHAANKLQQVQHAYEILNNDHTRLLYHKYGLIGGTDAAVQLLTGRLHHDNNNNYSDDDMVNAEQCRLLELMGYTYNHRHHNHLHHNHQSQQQQQYTHEQRIQTLTTTIIELLRPLVEDSISQETYIINLYSQLNTLKCQPLGAQILRCVGRAYKVEGWRILRLMKEEEERKKKKKKYHYHHYGTRKRRRNERRRLSSSNNNNHRIDNLLQDSWRGTKHYHQYYGIQVEQIIQHQQQEVTSNIYMTINRFIPKVECNPITSHCVVL